jgi:phosphatidylserine/phosphatidylglycerophosphate/cardiolipin synthase-like enzyme
MFRKCFLFLMVLAIPLCAWATVPSDKNAIIVCENSLEMLSWDLDFVSKANYSIEFSPNFTGGTVFRSCMEAFEKRMKQVPTLQVYVLAAPNLLEAPDLAMIDRFQKEYPHQFHLQYSDTIFAALPDYLTFDNHVKCMIIDEYYFSAGGTNFDEFQCVEGTTAPVNRRVSDNLAREMIPGGQRDQDVVGRGPIAKQIREEFYKLYALWNHYTTTYEFDRFPEHFANNSYLFPIPERHHPYLERFEKSNVLRAPASVELLLSIPLEKENPITNEYERLILEAKQSIVIANLYLNPDEALVNALMSAVNRGIEMQIVTNGSWEGSPNFGCLIAWANRLNYVPCLYGRTFHFWQKGMIADTPLLNTRIFEYQVGDTFLHKKVMVVDKRYTMVGSYNLGKRSNRGDYEMNLLIDSEEVASDFLKVIERDKTFSSEVKTADAVAWYFDPAISYFAALQKLLHGFM